MKLVLSGGGIKGIAYIGLWKKLKEKKIVPTEFHGTSIGSLFCAIFLLDQNTPLELYNLIQKFEWDLLSKINLQNFVSNFHLFNINLFKKHLYQLVPENLKFSDLKIPLYIYATDTFTNKIKEFSNYNTPDETICNAILASCALPFIFPPLYKRYIDGSIIQNLMLIKGGTHFLLKSPPKNFSGSVNFLEYLSNVLSCIFSRGNESYSCYDVVEIDCCSGNNYKNYKNIKKSINKLILIGYNCYE